jgi:hypothetical protein
MQAFAEAMYAVSYLEWALLGDLPKLTNEIPGFTIEGLSRKTLGAVAKETRKAMDAAVDSAEKAWLSAATDALEAVVEPRNGVIHAHPATSASGEQTLHRWAAAEGKTPHESEEVTEAKLRELKELACKHLQVVSAARLL